MLLIAPHLDFVDKAQIAKYPVRYLISALIFAAFFFMVARSLSKAKSLARYAEQHFVLVAALACAILLVIQVVIVQGCWFKSGWDVRVVTNCESLDLSYYSTYPNQIFLASLFRLIARVAAFWGFSNSYVSMVLGGCLSVSISVFLCALCTRKLAGTGPGYLALAIAIMLVGLSPWILVPYSDTYAMPWVALSFAALLFIEPIPFKFGCMTVCCLIGYAIKPTVIFVGLAAAIAYLARLAFCSFALKRKLVVVAQVLAASLAAVAITFGAINCVKAPISAQIDEEMAFGIPHFLMMGTNYDPEILGVYSQDDVDYSASFLTKNERNAADLKVWQERLRELGPFGYLKLFALKTFSNYSDGSFSWCGEGGFYLEVCGKNELLKSAYSIGVYASSPYGQLVQGLWIIVLVGVICCPFEGTSDRKTIAVFALLMLSVFLGIFERRARYLFLYLPIFIMLASCGLERIYGAINRHLFLVQVGISGREGL